MALLKSITTLSLIFLIHVTQSSQALAESSVSLQGFLKVEHLDTNAKSKLNLNLQFQKLEDKKWNIQFDGDTSNTLNHLNLNFTETNNLVITGLYSDPVELLNFSDLNCWRKEAPYVLVCWSKNNFQLDFIKDKTQLSVWAFANEFPSSNTVSHAADGFTVENLRALSLKKSFDNRAEYERVIQASQLARASYMALLPRLTFSTATNLATGGGFGTGMISLLGDLAPFLFPTNWINAAASDLRSQAESKTLNIQKLNIEQQVEGMSNLVIRDSNILTHYKDLLAEMNLVREQIETREKLGQYPVGSLNNIDSLRLRLTSDIATLTENIEDQKRALSIMVGFTSPDTIQNVYWQNEPFPIEKPIIITQENALKWGIERSVELAQMNILISLAETQEELAVWSWIDPSGAAFTGIGFHYPAMIEVSEAHVREMNIQKEQQKTQIKGIAINVTETLMLTQNLYKISIQQLDVDTKRKNLFTDQIKLGAAIDFFGLLQTYQDYLTSQSVKENHLAEYRTARARAQRLILEGAYSNLK